MDKKIKFGDFVFSTQGFIGIGLSIGSGLFAYYGILPSIDTTIYTNWGEIIATLLAIAFYSSYSIGFIRKYNSNINKNIEDRKKE